MAAWTSAMVASITSNFGPAARAGSASVSEAAASNPATPARMDLGKAMVLDVMKDFGEGIGGRMDCPAMREAPDSGPGAAAPAARGGGASFFPPAPAARSIARGLEADGALAVV